MLTYAYMLAAAHQLGRVAFQSGVQDEECVKQVGFTGTKALALLYWYKSTNTDAKDSFKPLPFSTLARSLPTLLRLSVHSVYWLYWYKCTNTDTEGAALAARASMLLSNVC